MTKFGKLPEWERGDLRPTLKQLDAFARAVHVPFGYLFLPDPPDERLPIPDFRTASDRAKTRASPDLIDTLYSMQRRQMWLREHLIESEAEPLEFVASATLDDDPDDVGREMRRTIGLDEGWARYVRTWQEAVSELRRMIERLGVMAVVNKHVGNDANRRLRAEEFGGFALTDRYAPLVFVNGADVKSGQMFNLAHELAHVWLGEEGLSGFENLLLGGTKVEDWCSRAAAEFLVPSGDLIDRWEQAKRTQCPIAVLAESLKASPVIVARRAMDLDLVTRESFLEFCRNQISKERQSSPANTEGDFCNDQDARVGKLFATRVMRAALEGRIGFKAAYDLTDLGGRDFRDYAARLGIRFV